jgi:adenine deaminase
MVHEFARAVVPRGTAGVVVDPHEYANVLGTKGVQYVLDAAEGLPLDIFVMMPSCVPATPFETSGAKIGTGDMASFISQPNVAGIAEMMNFPGVFLGWESELDKIQLGLKKTVDGHSPGLSGRNLNAYVLAGISSDHECTRIEEAREKLRLGMHILMREGTAERNLHELLPLVTAANASNFSFATDDKHPAGLMDEGHIDYHIREAVSAGVEPIMAIQMASINTARHYKLAYRGAIAPRYWADMVVFSDLRSIHAEEVYHKGALVARDGAYLAPAASVPDVSEMRKTMHVAPWTRERIEVRSGGKPAMKVIEIVPRQIVTNCVLESPLVKDGIVQSDTARDILKLIVVERHHGTGNIGCGFVRGFGLQQGAIGSTVAHDAHNIIVVGTNDDDIETAARHLEEMGGGQCCVCNGRVIEDLALPIAGLVSDQPLEYVRARVDALCASAASMGCILPDPFMTLSFLALSPIPALKVTDLGLMDSSKFEMTEIMV